MDLGHSARICASLVGFGPFCLDFGHFTWIWVILLGYELLSRIWVRNDGPQARVGDFWLDLGHFARIWAIMLGFGPFCLDLGHVAWIWAI